MKTVQNWFTMAKKFLLPLIILTGLLMRIFAVFIIGDTELQNEYGPIVMNMLAGRGFAYYSVDQNDELSTEFLEDPKFVIPSAFKSPVYPLFLAAFVKIFGSGYAGIWVIEIVQAFLAAIMCWLIYQISREKFGEPQALLAATGMAFYPLLVYSSTQISDTIMFLIFEILIFWLFVKLEKGFSFGLLAAFSLSVGMFMLARPEGLLYFPFFLIWLFFKYPERKLYVPAMFTLICIATLLPWGIRNYSQLGKFTLNTAGGLNLWEGENKDSVGVPSWYVTDPVIEISDRMKTEIYGPSFDRTFELRQDEVYMKNAIQDIKTHPAHSAILAIKKMLFFWTAIYFGINFSYPGAGSALYWLPWILMLPFFIYGLVLSMKNYKEYFLFYIVLLFSTAVNMAFVVLPRYTILIYPWAIVFAAHGIWTIYSSRSWPWQREKVLA